VTTDAFSERSARDAGRAKVESSAAELAGVQADRIAKTTMAGVLPDDEPVVRVTYTQSQRGVKCRQVVYDAGVILRWVRR
jgi:hypothetical protein